jgi:hypothetical protein
VQTEHRRRRPGSHGSIRARNRRNPFGTKQHPHYVIFIPKPGKDPKFPQNYRPISLLSNVAKVIEKVILTRLVKMANNNAAIPDEQFGFRPKHSTAD